jgi:hypothetical protein
MLQKVHFISGLPRSGSTLLPALLRQNPRFHAAMTGPVGGLVDRMLEAMSEDNEFSAFISNEQKRTLIASIFSAYYSPQADKSPVVQQIASNLRTISRSKNHLLRQKYRLDNGQHRVTNSAQSL